MRKKKRKRLEERGAGDKRMNSGRRVRGKQMISRRKERKL